MIASASGCGRYYGEPEFELNRAMQISNEIDTILCHIHVGVEGMHY